MTQDEVRELLNTFMIAVSKLVDAKSSGYVRSEICEVRFIDDLNVYVRPYSDVSTPTHISPSIVDDLDDGDIRIPNISGHALVAGDAVEILYTTNIEDAVIVRKVVYDPVDPGGGGGGGGGDIEPYTSNPHMDGTASPGSSSKYSRGDHVHPVDTSRASASELSSLSTTVSNKVDKVSGKGLSTNDYTTAEKNKLAAFGDASTYALKSEITGVYRYIGSVASASLLPTSGQTIGDVYDIATASVYGGPGMNVAWNGTSWDPLGEIFTITSISNATIDIIVAS